MGKGPVGAGLGAVIGATAGGLAGFGLVGIALTAGVVSILGHEAGESMKYSTSRYYSPSDLYK